MLQFKYICIFRKQRIKVLQNDKNKSRGTFYSHSRLLSTRELVDMSVDSARRPAFARPPSARALLTSQTYTLVCVPTLRLDSG